MKQDTRDHLFSTYAGIAAGCGVATVAAAVAAIVVSGVAVGGAACAAFCVVWLAAGVVGVATAIGELINVELGRYEKFRPGSALISGLATLAVGMGFLFGGNKSSTAQNSTPAKAPVENTKGISFLNHENAFNAPAQNGKKALTAKDFSSAPVAAQKALAA